MQPLQQPTQNRNHSIDAIRGFALFGILMVNYLSFHSPHFMYGGMDEFHTSSGDQTILTIIDWFFQASFYPLFSLLFGIGIYMMYIRLQAKAPEQSKKILIRRMIVLGFIGLIHGVFIWYGDILLTYSVIGLISILFLNMKVKTLVKTAVSMLVIVATLFSLMYYGIKDYLESYRDQQSIQASFENYQGGFSQIFSQNLNDWLVMVGPFQWLVIIPTILPMFLFGIALMKSGWLTNTEAHLSSMKKALYASGLIFLVFKIGPYAIGMPAWLDLLQDTLGGSASSLFYFLGAMIIFETGKLNWLKHKLSPVGKMSLTNYLSQSVVGYVLFYGVGVALYGQLTLIVLVMVVVTVFLLQVMVSSWYAKRFYYGPAEWIYRSLTYGKVQKWKR
ncbi:DUF418 domain-containing protein [Halalkalibacillus halophilus]|uniref:DUF418 domain-containing protein n=1 Tax=Halalkalibacillus halophilus TaxID=392827 RepID=UPI00040F950A|nr:DUF418 domain-containing protein [Halalkalibacillus halophilus]